MTIGHSRIGDMERRKIAFILLMLAAGGGPYVLMSDALSSLKEKWHSFTSSIGSEQTTLSLAQPTDIGTGLTFGSVESNKINSNFSATLRPETQSVTQPPNIQEVFHFGITPGWVVSRWPRVSTSLANLEMEGMRVPLVTGTESYDLHGSLTYYFDRAQKLQRITFYGYTDDPNVLADLITRYYGLKPEKTLDAGLFLKGWNGKPRSLVWVGHSPATRSGGHNARYSVKLELNRPDGRYQLSEEFVGFLEELRSVGRWE